MVRVLYPENACQTSGFAKVNIESEFVNLLTKLMPPPSSPITWPHFDATSANTLSGTIAQKFTTFGGNSFIHTSRNTLFSGPSIRRMVFSGNSSAMFEMIFHHVSVGSERIEYAPRKINIVSFDCFFDLQFLRTSLFLRIATSFSLSLSFS